MARILTKAQLSKLESKSQAELLAIVLDLATHLPLAKKHLINQYLTAEDAFMYRTLSGKRINNTV
ncbi:hypothetical protein U1439_16610 [Aeromonas caviae]|uniref:hypothetical protein n=1 Tax=Aeromonas caviae TaxID=648 RepID=UPI0030154B83